ncbi:MAG: hypothetical protein KKA42_01085, partial [candidate division Zixibacteria bacterium]|nr:hypothetical protein [candidate division Zixibacteria bacterium]
MTKRIVLMGLTCALLLSSAWAIDDEESAQKIMSVEAIDWNVLAGFLPTGGDDVEVSDLDGGTMNMADPTNPSAKISYSNVERTYT